MTIATRARQLAAGLLLAAALGGAFAAPAAAGSHHYAPDTHLSRNRHIVHIVPDKKI